MTSSTSTNGHKGTTAITSATLERTLEDASTLAEAGLQAQAAIREATQVLERVQQAAQPQIDRLLQERERINAALAALGHTDANPHDTGSTSLSPSAREANTPAVRKAARMVKGPKREQTPLKAALASAEALVPATFEGKDAQAWCKGHADVLVPNGQKREFVVQSRRDAYNAGRVAAGGEPKTF